METGPSISPVTLRPKQQADPQRRKIREAQAEADLRAQAADLGLGISGEAERFRKLIVGRLESRLSALVMADPEACAYMNILKEMGHKFNVAKRAADSLYRRHMGINPKA